jgi:hypothetical protein
VADAMKVWAMLVFLSRSSSGFVRGLALGAVLSAAAPSVVWAQLSSPVPGGGSPTSRMQSRAPEKPSLPAPDAVPGDKARAPAAPSTHSAGDLQPTDALFDAINRGDIASARDALNRGADLNGVNILGMTPMELSVDLGRNDISFLLLSMRGEDSGRGSRAVGRDDAASGKPVKTTAPARSAAETRAARTKAAELPVATRPIAAPKLFANDGGTALPSVGFLGFDSGSTAN